MSNSPESRDTDLTGVTAQQAVKSFMDEARKHLHDDDLAIALVSAGAGLMASTRGIEPAVEALRRAIVELRIEG